ncbi:MAG: DUF1289 domain-containing protein [Porticoccaceae bacterium]|nr:DUF1289 domain-containing protein [Porticoccaceae bacterium]
MTESKTTPALVASPCVSICVLDDKDICRGCYRSGDEIRNWLMASDPERVQLLANARERSKEGNPFAAG